MYVIGINGVPHKGYLRKEDACRDLIKDGWKERLFPGDWRKQQAKARVYKIEEVTI